MAQEPSINIGEIRDSTGIQIGSNNTQHFNFGDETKVDFNILMERLIESTPEKERPKVEVVVEEIKEAVKEEPSPTLQERIKGLIGKLEPYTPYLKKTLAAFTEGALKTIPPPASWVVGGALEVCKQERNDA